MQSRSEVAEEIEIANPNICFFLPIFYSDASPIAISSGSSAPLVKPCNKKTIFQNIVFSPSVKFMVYFYAYFPSAQGHTQYHNSCSESLPVHQCNSIIIKDHKVFLLKYLFLRWNLSPKVTLTTHPVAFIPIRRNAIATQDNFQNSHSSGNRRGNSLHLIQARWQDKILLVKCSGCYKPSWSCLQRVDQKDWSVCVKYHDYKCI